MLGEVVDPVVVGAAAGQPLPELPDAVEVLRDRHENCGPLEGIAVGLQALADRCEAAYVTACDVPLLRPEFVRRMVELVAGHDVAVPHIEGFDEPLAAVYRTGVLPHVQSLLTAGRRRPVELFEQVGTHRVTANELIDVDPQLQSLANLNTPEDYEAALRDARLA